LLEQRITTLAQMKWLPKLMGFNYEIVYKKGIENEPADALSRVDTGSQLLSMVLTSVTTDLLPQIMATCDSTGGHSGIAATNTKNSGFLLLEENKEASQGVCFKVAQLFLDNVYKLHGLPKIIVNDRDKIFLSLFWKERIKMLQMSLQFSTAYHPQLDGTNFYTFINTTPFEAVYGQPPSSPILYSPGKSKVDSVDRSLVAREAIRQMLQFHLE
nr:hypothetical protein [Tanacetum cinerariifolium]